MPEAQSILFTAFEASGDEHAAPVIAQLKRLRPELTVWALGGPRMEAAGARIIESSTQHPVMLAGIVGQYFHHKRRLARLRAWLAEHPIDALVPVDSPAANWSICKLVRRSVPGARIVHLVAPQMWAWGEWRIAKMRRLSDHALCLLPFEVPWFAQRGVAATFVGHPVLDDEAMGAPVAPLAGSLDGSPKLAMLPGSRPGEIKANWPTMHAVYRRLKADHPGLAATVGAFDERAAELVRAIIGREGGDVSDPSLQVRVAETPGVLAWADVVLVKSGTSTLHVAMAGKPMVVMYNISWWAWNLVARWVIRSRNFTLPNLLSEAVDGKAIVPALVPHFGEVEPVWREVSRLVDDSGAQQRQREGLARIAALFRGKRYDAEAAQQILKVIEGSR